MGDWGAASEAFPSAGWVQVPWGHRHPALSLPLALLCSPSLMDFSTKSFVLSSRGGKASPGAREQQKYRSAHSSEDGAVLCPPLKRPKKTQRPELSLSCGVFRLGSSLWDAREGSRGICF